MKGRKEVILLVALLLSGGMVGLASIATADSGLYSANVNVPYYVYTGQQFNLYVNNTFGYSNYSVTIYFAGDNLSGFSPTTTYHNFSASNPDFVIPMTAPGTVQQITVFVKSSAQSSSNTFKASSTYTINVVKPIYLYASVSNKNSVAMYNVTVNFYVDSNFVASKTIPTLSPGQSTMVNYTWTAPYLKNGEHSLTVQVNNSLISINSGGSSVTNHFYYGTPPNYTWIYYIVAAVGVFMIIMVMGAGRRPRVGERSPKWKK